MHQRFFNKNMALVVLWKLSRNFFDSSSGRAPCWGVQIRRNVQSVAAAAGHCLAPCDRRSCSLSSLTPTTRSLQCYKLPMSIPQCEVISQGFLQCLILGILGILISWALQEAGQSSSSHGSSRTLKLKVWSMSWSPPPPPHIHTASTVPVLRIYLCTTLVHNIWTWRASSRNNILRSKFFCSHFHMLTSSKLKCY